MLLMMNRNHTDLLRCQPYWEMSCEMLNQDTDKAFNGTEDYAMKHDRTYLGAVFFNISQIKSLRQIHVQLNGTALPFSSQRILDMEIQLRTIECSVSRIHLIILSCMNAGICQCFFTLLPNRQISNVFLFRTCRKLDAIAQSEHRIYTVDKLNQLHNFAFNLIGTHKDMCIILCKCTDAEQSV